MNHIENNLDNAIRNVFTSKFPLGQTVMTPGARDTLNQSDMLTALGRHAQGDWGDCCQDDRNENELSLEFGLKLFSVYSDRRNRRFWIITEADRSVTTILLPSEY
ncbi:MAG TPA: hypothetical protein VGL56_20985 [Fimbriimonadaceae bacterium]